MIRRYPNVGTHHKLCYGIITGIHTVMRGTRGTETSKYLEEKKINNDYESSGERNCKSPNLG